MKEKLNVISSRELQNILGSRVSLDYNAFGKRIQEKEINEAVIMQNRILHSNNTHIKPITFDGCIFNEDVNIGEFDNAGHVTFSNCTFNKSIKVEFPNSSFEGSCIFNNDLVIQSRHDVELLDYTIKGALKIGGSPSKISLRNINQGQEINDQKIIIEASTRELSLHAITGKVLELLDNTRFSSEFNFKNVEVSTLKVGAISLDTVMLIAECNIINFQIGNIKGEDRSLSIDNSVIGELILKISALTKIFINGGSISNLVLSESNEKESIVNVEKTTIVKLKFERVFNNGLITLRELQIPPKGLVSFRSSNLGKADFIYCNFSKANLEFENCKITEAFFSETEFPKRVLISGKKNHGQAQLAFGQLATAFQKQGDNIRAAEYNSRELEAHYKTLLWLSPDFFQKVNLWLNRISNNFGRNWILGVIFSFGVGLLFFCLLLVSTEKYKWGIPQIDYDIIPAYLKFMNPLRFFELDALFNNTPKEDDIKLGGKAYFADFGGRIFVAYGYYQTIQAFRRFGRK